MAKTAKQGAQPEFNGAALIDEQGNEIAITEDMIREAFRALDDTACAEEDQAGRSDSDQDKA